MDFDAALRGNRTTLHISTLLPLSRLEAFPVRLEGALRGIRCLKIETGSERRGLAAARKYFRKPGRRRRGGGDDWGIQQEGFGRAISLAPSAPY